MEEKCWIGSTPEQRVSGTILGKNSLWQYDQGQHLGIPPLRAVEFRE